MLEQCGNCRGGEKWPKPGYILRLEASECANGLNTGPEKERSQEKLQGVWSEQLEGWNVHLLT